METLLVVIFVVFGILQIVLFFKLWGMTNDIRKIKKQSIDDRRLVDAKTAYLNGQIAIAKKLLDDGLRIVDTDLERDPNSQEFNEWRKRILSTYKYLGFDTPKK